MTLQRERSWCKIEFDISAAQGDSLRRFLYQEGYCDGKTTAKTQKKAR